MLNGYPPEYALHSSFNKRFTRFFAGSDSKTPNINAPIKQKIYLILLFPDVIFIKKEITPTTEAMVAAVVLLIFSFAIFLSSITFCRKS